jgi:lysozyme
MRISPAGKELIQHFEGCKLEAYRCSAGVLTIGYGHTGDVKEGDTITQEMADLMLLRDLRKFEIGIDGLVKAQITQNQFDSLVSLAFNVGLGNLSTSTLIRMINAGSADAAADQFLRWNRAAGRVMPGLTRRREAERKHYKGQSWQT